MCRKISKRIGTIFLQSLSLTFISTLTMFIIFEFQNEHLLFYNLL